MRDHPAAGPCTAADPAREARVSAIDRESGGVTLNTEDSSNIRLYQHFGYRGHRARAGIGWV